jgi:hypothetical protein
MADVQAAIRIHGEDLLSIPGVISVKPGYRFKNGRITSDPAVIVKVDRKRDESELAGAVVPKRLGKILVDVLDANPLAQYRVQRDQELAGPGGAPEAWRISTALPGEEEEPGGDDLAGPLLPYVPPDEPASEVNQVMTVICHSSCDSGFRLLKGFFDRTQESMVSTMYEFTAEHVLDALVPNLEDPKTFEFIFDGKGKRLGADDLPPADVLDRLNRDVGSRMTFAWAANAQAGRVVSAGFFPSAYHIKVSVRDGQETWLSSGNWKRSGQPKVDPFDPPQGFSSATFEREHNREWHVLIDNEALASQFARYIRHDIEQALPLQLEEAGPVPEVMPDLFVPLPDTEAAGPPVFRRELTVNRQLRALPLFTPDRGSYFDFVKDAIANASRKIWFENQSLSPNANDETYMDELFLVLAEKSRNADIDVKMIVRGDFDPDEILAKLQAWEFNMDRVRLLGGIHTKGIIVDDELVVIGSHNWTSQGVLRNRDASIVFRDSEIIDYYNALFEYDWNRASDTLGPAPMLAAPGQAAPAGFVRVPWTTVMED